MNQGNSQGEGEHKDGRGRDGRSGRVNKLLLFLEVLLLLGLRLGLGFLWARGLFFLALLLLLGAAAAAAIDGELGLGGSLSSLGRGVCHELVDRLLEFLRAGRSGSRRERKVHPLLGRVLVVGLDHGIDAECDNRIGHSREVDRVQNYLEVDVGLSHRRSAVQSKVSDKSAGNVSVIEEECGRAGSWLPVIGRDQLNGFDRGIGINLELLYFWGGREEGREGRRGD